MISSEDFNLLQEQLISLKRDKYESSEKEKKLQNEIKQLKDQLEEGSGNNSNNNDSAKKKATSFFSDVVARKGKMNEIQDENEHLRKQIQQNTIVHQEQSDALKLNIKSLFETNSQLEDQILLLKKDLNTYIIKGEDQQNLVRKLQVDLAESHCTNEELENKIKELSLNNSISNNNSDIGSEVGDCSSVNGANNINSGVVTLESIIQVLDSLSSEEDVKEKITELFNLKQQEQQQQQQQQQSINNTTTTPPSPVTPKEIIFHPLGEPEYNPDNEKEKQKLRDTIKNLMEQIRENDSKSIKTVNDIKESQQINEQLSQQVTQWQDKHRQSEINRVKIEERLENELKRLKEEQTLMEQQKQQLIQENQDIHQALQTSSKKFEKSIESVDEALHQQKEKFEKLLQEKQQELSQQKLHFERSLSDLNDKSDIFKQSRDEYLTNYNQSIDEIKIKDQVIASKVMEVDQLNQRIKEFESTSIDERNQSIDLLSQLEDSKNSHNESLSKLKKLEEKLVLERSNFDSLNQRFNIITLDHNDSIERTKQVEKQLIELENEKDSLKQTNQSQSLQLTEFDENLTNLNQTLQEKQQLIQSLESELKEKSDALITFKELQDQLELLNSNLSETTLKLDEATSRLSILEPEFEKIKLNYDEACIKITKLEVSLVDFETERKIAEKKNVKMIKDLKMELSQSRDSFNLLSQSSSSIGGVASGQLTPNGTNNGGGGGGSGQNTPLRGSNGSISLPSTPIVTPIQSRHQRTASRDFQLSSPTSNNNNFAYTSSPISNKPPLIPSSQSSNFINNHALNGGGNNNNGISDIQLRTDFELMGKKLGELGTENYKLDERNRTLELKNRQLTEDLEKKSNAVRLLVSKTQLGKATSEEEKAKKLKSGGFMGSFWRNNDPKIAAEMVEKMEVMLQENVLKNFQLSNDLELLGTETGKLKSQLSIYESILKENNIEKPTFKNLHENLKPNNFENNNNNDDNSTTATTTSIQIGSEENYKI
ncbi:hypothetical protein DDB_G0278351 [Dictyostelium discoideum AX4]|uniref:Uncharacterized protein n=1 Tax=Dictyostelium discoideum TaxID=44689 RepID=Q54Y97_DICDI|nr:hypothetical protein DDB_G0278351 [Dictyostelium discoideum AX4]EAL68348.1 hypothetical protein DDB_G0278351 [Dictyostelium discoideum AX4]|eukprot:XP_642305.1 hypothetical protein DDB_G0278351 [Dictyostelium discoideum AX4]